MGNSYCSHYAKSHFSTVDIEEMMFTNSNEDFDDEPKQLIDFLAS